MKKTPLYAEHLELGAKMIDFAGWEMPVQYRGVIEEHKCVRSSVGMFDLTHMGEFLLTGSDALKNLSYLTTNDPGLLEEGQIQYSLLTNSSGGIVDDILVYREKNSFYLVVNASNIDKDYQWISQHLQGDCKLTNVSEQTTLIAVQGPNSQILMEQVFGINLSELKYYHFFDHNYQSHQIRISRTGYTGEDGFELYLPNVIAVELWRKIFDMGQAYNIQPIGLGARDTLRLEMRLSLYGNDIDDTTTPLEAGLVKFVKLDKENFIGKQALVAQKAQGITRKLVGFVMEEKGIARHGYNILKEGVKIGEVTSGSMSPIREQGIGMGYVPAELTPGTHIDIEIRKKVSQAIIVKGRFVSVNK